MGHWLVALVILVSAGGVIWTSYRTSLDLPMVGVGRHRPTPGIKSLSNTLIVCWRHNCAKTAKVTRQSRALRPRFVGGRFFVLIHSHSNISWIALLERNLRFGCDDPLRLSVIVSGSNC